MSRRILLKDHTGNVFHSSVPQAAPTDDVLAAAAAAVGSNQIRLLCGGKPLPETGNLQDLFPGEAPLELGRTPWPPPTLPSKRGAAEGPATPRSSASSMDNDGGGTCHPRGLDANSQKLATSCSSCSNRLAIVWQTLSTKPPWQKSLGQTLQKFNVSEGRLGGVQSLCRGPPAAGGAASGDGTADGPWRGRVEHFRPLGQLPSFGAGPCCRWSASCGRGRLPARVGRGERLVLVRGGRNTRAADQKLSRRFRFQLPPAVLKMMGRTEMPYLRNRRILFRVSDGREKCLQVRDAVQAILDREALQMQGRPVYATLQLGPQAIRLAATAKAKEAVLAQAPQPHLSYGWSEGALIASTAEHGAEMGH